MPQKNTPQLRLAREKKEDIFHQNGEDIMTCAILHLAWDLGLTASEIAGLRWEELGLSEGILRLNGREMPIPKEVRAFFAAMERQGPYVIFMRGSEGQATNRGSVSRKVRGALDAAGLPDIDLRALRDLCVLELLERYPIESVVRMTGLEVRSLQTLHRRCAGESMPSARKEKSFALDREALWEALRREGDTLDSRVVLLSWQGGLLLREMRLLCWDDIDLEKKIWTISGKKRPIPSKMAGYLAQWQAEAPGYVLRTQHEKPVARAFLTRRASEFFVRYGMEELSLFSLWGRRRDDHSYKNKILKLAEKWPELDARSIAPKLGLSVPLARHFLDEMTAQGLLERVREEPAEKGPSEKQRLAAILMERKGQTVTPAELKRLTGLSDNRLQYYLSVFMREGVITKEKHGVYRC